MLRNALMACAALNTGHALAHDGHGWVGTHLHAGDLFGLTVLALAAGGFALWRGRK